MKKSKKMLSLLVALAVFITAITVIPLTAGAANKDAAMVGETYTSGFYEYTYLGQGNVEITKYNGTALYLNIPSTLDGYNVTDVGGFGKNYDLISATIPVGVKNICDEAFIDCYNLKSVSIPTGVTRIGSRAFWDTGLQTIVIPDSVVMIDDYAFIMCNNLENVTLGASLASIGKIAFGKCELLKEIVIPSSVNKIDNKAFGYGCRDKYGWESWYSLLTESNNYESYKDFVVKGYSGTDAERYAQENGFTFISLGEQPTTSETITETTVAETTAPLNEGYYVVGDFNGDFTWDDYFHPEYKMLRDTTHTAHEQYILKNIYLYKEDELKVVYKDSNLSTVKWYPEGMDNNYTISEAGYYDILFRPNSDGDSNWWDGNYGYYISLTYLGAVLPTEAPTEEPTTAPTEPATEVPTETTTEPTVDPEAPQLTVSEKTAIIGLNVSVDIAIENNPGIVGMTLDVGYDSDALTLTEVKDGGILGTNTHKPELTSPYTLSWSNDTASSNITANGVIATLVFKVSDDAELGNYPITLSYDYDNYDIYDVDINKVKFETVNGVVSVKDVLYGDVNGDGRVNNIDRVHLTRYLAKWADYQEINLANADVNDDGKVNNIDKVVLTRHLAKWNDYAVLPCQP